jgi:hypothetical protein
VKPIRGFALLLLLMPLLTNVGCQVKYISATMPVPDSALLVKGETSYGEILRDFGPPGFIGGLPFGGFAMLYESVSVSETNFGFSAEGRAFGQSGGHRSYHFCGLLFDEHGVLFDTIVRRTDLDLGDELLLGSDKDAGNFGKKDWGAGASPHTWGMRGLMPLPKLLNRASGDIEIGVRGIELFDQPVDCGQHTLERPIPLPIPKSPF